MPGETQLATLLANMEPTLHIGRWVFASMSSAKFNELLKTLPLDRLQGLYQEAEGVSLILDEKSAISQGIDYQESFSCISLSIHSSLEAVGLTAAISTALAKENISANVVAAYYHDHIYVPQHQAEAAIKCLKALSVEQKAS